MKQDNNLEDFSKFILKEAGTEVPSKDFVNNVMVAINFEESKSTLTIYKPLISKQVWFLISVILVGLCIFILSNTNESSIQLPAINLSLFNKLNSLNILEKIKIPNVFVFSSVLFSVLVLFQLTLIKKYFYRHNSI